MDPDNQPQDPDYLNENDEMLIDPNDQINQLDDTQIIEPQDIDEIITQKSANIMDESQISKNSEVGIASGDDGNEDLQLEYNEEDEAESSTNGVKIKALSEKEEPSPLEETSTNIAMSLLTSNQNDNAIEGENTKEGANFTDNENLNNIRETNIDEKINDNPINENNINSNEDKIENELNNGENKDQNENADSNENIVDTENKDENVQNQEIENDNNEHTSEEGMEVKDNLTPLRPFRQTNTFLSNESLSKLPPLSTDPDLDAENLRLLNNFKKRGRLPDVTQRTQLVQYIQREKINNVVAQKFGKAQEYQNLLQRYQKAIIEQEIKERNQEKIETLKINLETAEEDLKNTEKQAKIRIVDEKEKQKEHYYELLQKQDDEFNVFERKWNDPNFIQKYAKPSSLLLAMKTKERSMVITKMFDQAEYVHNKVKELEKIESRQAQETAEKEMKKEKQKILTKQDSEIQAYRLHCTQQIELIKRNNEIEKKKKEIKIAKLKEEIKEFQKNPPTSLPSMSSTSSDVLLQTIMTPRTLTRYSMYKSQANKPVLTLNPIKNIRPSKKSRKKIYSSLT